MTLEIILLLFLFLALFLSFIAVYDSPKGVLPWAVLLIAAVLVIRAVQ